MLPDRPAGQRQEKEPNRLTHEPPYRQGLIFTHSFTSVQAKIINLMLVSK